MNPNTELANIQIGHVVSFVPRDRSGRVTIKVTHIDQGGACALTGYRKGSNAPAAGGRRGYFVTPGTIKHVSNW